MKNALYVLLGVIAGFILAGVLVFVSRAPAGEPIVLQPAPTEAPIAIHVIGAVARPGLYKLPEGARMQDAIDAAGGLLTTANAGTLNLAAMIEDGQQLDIPFMDGEGPIDNSAFALPGITEVPDASGSGASGAELINVNTATVEELISLPGIGSVTAQKIIEYRDQNGYFYTPEDLLNVAGIGTVTLDNIRNLISTDAPN